MDEQAFRPQWQFKFQAHFDKWFGLPPCLKTYHLSLYNIKKDMLLTGPFAVLSMPSFDFHLPPCTEGFLIHLSPLWQLPLWQLPLFPSVAQFPCVPRLFFFIGNMVYQGGDYPLMNLKLTGPKYYYLVPWYRVGSPHSIDTNMTGLKKPIFSDHRQNWKKKSIFSLKKSQISEFHPVFCI